MNCYSSYDGVAVTGSPYYMTELLRNELGFKGYVYSDWGSVHMLYRFHMAAENGAEAAKWQWKQALTWKPEAKTTNSWKNSSALENWTKIH